MKFFVDTSIFVDCLRKNVIPSSKYFLESFGDEHTGFTSSITRNTKHFERIKAVNALIPEDIGF